jgi:hypothetical protein
MQQALTESQLKFGIHYSYWEQEWSADRLKYVEKVAKLGFDVIEIAAHHLNSYSPAHIAEVVPLETMASRSQPDWAVPTQKPVLRRPRDQKSGTRLFRRDADQPRQTRYPYHRRRPPLLLADRLFQARRQGGRQSARLHAFGMLRASASKTAMRTATPISTCSRMSDCELSATSVSISTPRFIGPGCMTSAPGLA